MKLNHNSITLNFSSCSLFSVIMVVLFSVKSVERNIPKYELLPYINIVNSDYIAAAPPAVVYYGVKYFYTMYKNKTIYIYKIPNFERLIRQFHDKSQ